MLDSPGSTRLQPPDSQIPRERTEPALDLDLLLGGLKPVIQGLNAQNVNALTNSLIQILQGQGGTVESLLSHTSTFTQALADNGQTVQQLIDNLNTVMATVARDGEQFSGAVQRLQQLVTGLSEQRDPIGEAITALDNGTASLTDLMTQARPPLSAPWTSSPGWRPCSPATTARRGWTCRCRRLRRTTASSSDSAPTAASSINTCAG